MSKYRVNEETVRPYRVWHEGERREVPGRRYSDVTRAHNAITSLARWEKVGTVLELFNAQTGRQLMTYRRGVDKIDFRRAD